jgi:hypothetical protein
MDVDTVMDTDTGEKDYGVTFVQEPNKVKVTTAKHQHEPGNSTYLARRYPEALRHEHPHLKVRPLPDS